MHGLSSLYFANDIKQYYSTPAVYETFGANNKDTENNEDNEDSEDISDLAENNILEFTSEE